MEVKAVIRVEIKCDSHGSTDSVEMELDKFTDAKTMYAAFLGVGAPLVDLVAFRFSQGSSVAVPNGWRD